MAAPTAIEETQDTLKRLFAAAERDDVTKLLDFFDLENVEENHEAEYLNYHKNTYDQGVIHVAAEHGSSKILLEILTYAGLEINCQDRDEETPLHKAAKFNISPPDSDRDTGLNIIKHLIEKGADPRIRNTQNERPCDLLNPEKKKSANPKASKLLIDAEAEISNEIQRTKRQEKLQAKKAAEAAEAEKEGDGSGSD